MEYSCIAVTVSGQAAVRGGIQGGYTGWVYGRVIPGPATLLEEGILTAKRAPEGPA